jgi:pimeloyl-ACP methyl ester carboxylesterase
MGEARGQVQQRRVPVAEGVMVQVLDWTPAAGAAQERPPFLLVHGLASNARMWDGVAGRLAAEGHRSAAVDLRGHGRSDKPDEGYEIDRVGADVRAVVDALGLERPVLVGQSWGGNVVVDVAAAWPALASGVVLVDGGWIDLPRRFPSWDDCRATLTPPALAGRPAARVEAAIRAAHPDWPETGITGAMACFEVLPDGTARPWLSLDHHLAALRGMWEARPVDRYARVEVPVLLIPADSGSPRIESTRIDVAAAEAALPASRTVWVTGHHDLHAEQPAIVAGLLLDCVRDGFFR